MSKVWDDVRERPEQQVFLVGVVCAAVLAMALGLQYFGGYLPCELCVKERYAYYAGVALCVAAWLAASAGQRRLAAVFIGIAGLGLLFNAGLGLYHAGVEWHWWAGPSTCTGDGNSLAASGSDLLKSLQNQNVVRCDQPALRVFGLSLAAWNIPIGAALAAVAAFAVAGLAKPSIGRL